MSKTIEPKFMLPPIRPEKKTLQGTTSVKKCENSLSIPKDNVRLIPELDILIEQQRKKELSEKLIRKHHYAELLRQKLEVQWKLLEHNELTFQRTIMSHNRFLRRNLEKRERALAKIQADNEQTRKREKEIKALDQKYDFFNAVLNKLRLEIRNHSIYEDYLNAAVNHPDSPFKNDLDFLTKYESLQTVKEHCVKRQTDEMATTVLLHDDNLEIFRLQGIALIGLRNELNNLRVAFDSTCRKNLATETLITNIVNRTNELNIEVSSVQYMIDAIYRYICHRRKIPQMDYELKNVKPRIDVLKSTLSAWEKVLNSSELTRHRKKTLRKSQFWKPSVVQNVFMWKKKTGLRHSVSDIGLKKTVSSFK
ncbi:coiled-coil domain-containing protein 42 like-2-like [Harmonia axyridis]|uniref:coiled-coil domain-containing protein 42 like-2-like n=1 Tax=Harmonia axyridis TaxID=115357 RepID=UPI001E2799BB|nr:coiled-coil domain-containing protein 42 like-2-like [Harmonia axyridis]